MLWNQYGDVHCYRHRRQPGNQASLLRCFVLIPGSACFVFQSPGSACYLFQIIYNNVNVSITLHSGETTPYPTRRDHSVINQESPILHQAAEFTLSSSLLSDQDKKEIGVVRNGIWCLTDDHSICINIYQVLANYMDILLVNRLEVLIIYTCCIQTVVGCTVKMWPQEHAHKVSPPGRVAYIFRGFATCLRD